MSLGSAAILEPGERPILVVRSHLWPLVRAALPLPVLVLSPVAYMALDYLAPDLRLAALFPVFLWLLLAVLALYLLKWLLFDLLPWSQRVYVLTNRRVMAQSGVLAVHRRECSLLNIGESEYQSRGVVSRLLDIGDVEVQTSGGMGTIELRAVSQPRRVQGAISAQVRALREEVSRHRLSDEPDEVTRRLETIIHGAPQPDHVPTEEFRPISKRVIRAQKRLNLLPDEVVVEVVRQHVIVLVVGLLGPLLGVLFCIAVVAILGLELMPAAVAGVVGILAPWAVWRVLSYFAHEYVMTTDRLMELRSAPLVFETRNVVQLGSIQDVSLEIPTIFGRLADIGDVVVEVSGPAEHLVLKTVGRPGLIQKRIFEVIDQRSRRQREREDRRLATTLTRWFDEYHRLQDRDALPREST